MCYRTLGHHLMWCLCTPDRISRILGFTKRLLRFAREKPLALSGYLHPASDQAHAISLSRWPRWGYRRGSISLLLLRTASFRDIIPSCARNLVLTDVGVSRRLAGFIIAYVGSTLVRKQAVWLVHIFRVQKKAARFGLVHHRRGK